MTTLIFSAVMAVVTGIDAVKGFSDGICEVTNIISLTEADKAKNDAFTRTFAAEVSRAVKAVEGGFTRIDYVIRAEPGSDIRCRLELPPPEKWNGRLFGCGNSGYAGRLPSITAYVAEGSAAMTTDLGTWRYTHDGTNNDQAWPEPVRRDYYYRATHLMTVYGKILLERFYGRKQTHAYFQGGSCGGRQAIGEAVRYPDDYEAIAASLPDSGVQTASAIFNAFVQGHDDRGRMVLTTPMIRAVSDAAVEYYRDRDPAPYVGYYLADARAGEKDVKAIVELAAKKVPSIAGEDIKARLGALFLPVVHKGRCVTTGFPVGSFPDKVKWISFAGFKNYLLELDRYPPRAEKTVPAGRHPTWDDFDDWVKREGRYFNIFSAKGFRRFAERGGRLIIVSGWEDQTVPPAPHVDFFERICDEMGGIDRALGSVRLFCVPGCAHGGGQGRARKGSAGEVLRKALVDWTEKGVAPEALVMRDVINRRELRVSRYPFLSIRDEKGAWKSVERPRGVPKIDPFYLECEIDM